MSLSARKPSSTSEEYFSPDYIKERVFLNRLTLSKLATVDVSGAQFIFSYSLFISYNSCFPFPLWLVVKAGLIPASLTPSYQSFKTAKEQLPVTLQYKFPPPNSPSHCHCNDPKKGWSEKEIICGLWHKRAQTFTTFPHSNAIPLLING